MKFKFSFKPFLYLILIIYALVTLYPFLFAVTASFKTYAELTSGGLSLIPKNFTLENYNYIFSGTVLYPRWFLNSVFVAVIGTVENVFLNSMAGYALAQINFRGGKSFFYIMIAAMAIPGQVLLIPNFLIIHALGLMDSYAAVLIPGAINLTYIFMMRQYYINFSKNIEEAAKIDGLSRAGSFFRIVLPLSKPVLATQATFVFLGWWNNFTNVMLYIKDVKNFTLPLGIQYTQVQYGTLWNRIMAFSVISLIPILIMYIVLNRYFMQSVRMEGEK